jgi:hypothetical protein
MLDYGQSAPSPRAAGEQVGRGVAYALLTPLLAVPLWLVLWKLGWYSSIIASGATIAAVLLYRAGARGISARAIAPIALIVGGTVVLCLLASIAFDGAEVAPMRSGRTLTELAGDDRFWEWFGAEFLTAPTTWARMAPIAVWALVLSAVGALPVLGHLRGGARWGVGAAIAASVVGTAIGVTLVPALSSTLQEAALEGIDPGSIAESLEVGDCIDDPAMTQVGGTPEIALADCADYHDGEVIGVVDLQGEPGSTAVPSEDAMVAQLDAACDPLFATVTATPIGPDPLGVGYYYPQPDGWELQGQRHGICVVSDPSGPRAGALAAG